MRGRRARGLEPQGRDVGSRPASAITEPPNPRAARRGTADRVQVRVRHLLSSVRANIPNQVVAIGPKPLVDSDLASNSRLRVASHSSGVSMAMRKSPLAAR